MVVYGQPADIQYGQSCRAKISTITYLHINQFAYPALSATYSTYPFNPLFTLLSCFHPSQFCPRNLSQQHAKLATFGKTHPLSHQGRQLPSKIINFTNVSLVPWKHIEQDTTPVPTYSTEITKISLKKLGNTCASTDNRSHVKK